MSSCWRQDVCLASFLEERRGGLLLGPSICFQGLRLWSGKRLYKRRVRTVCIFEPYLRAVVAAEWKHGQACFVVVSLYSRLLKLPRLFRLAHRHVVAHMLCTIASGGREDLKLFLHVGSASDAFRS